jgi:hypothetical protein
MSDGRRLSPELRQRLDDLLSAYGRQEEPISREAFWAGMAEAGLGAADIDQYCLEEARWIPPSPDDKGKPRLHPRPRFVCQRCGADVYRPGRTADDVNNICISCWHGRARVQPPGEGEEDDGDY